MNPDDRQDGPGIIVGTAGHVDHGKTTLVRALTGVDTDRWGEEKDRGLTIDLGFAPLDVGGGRRAGVVDVPGHEDFVKNMLAGATGMDLLLLVVAADEGPMPQTREHLDIAALLGVRRGVVALTKVDRVQEEWVELARDAVREALEATPGVNGEEWPVVAVSAVEGLGIDPLRAALEAQAQRVTPRPAGDLFRMPVDRAFTLAGSGTVVTGTVWSGRIGRDRTVRVIPGGREARVRSVEVHGEERQAARAGQRCGLALVGVSTEEVARGRTLVHDPEWEPATTLGARLRLLPHADRIVEHGQRVRIYLGTEEVMARTRLPGREALAPGQEGWARLELEGPAVARARDRFVLRFYSPVRTLGGGRVARLDPPRGESPEDGWGRILDGAPRAAARAAVALAGRRGLDPRRLPLLTGLRRGELPSEAPGESLSAGGRWFAPGVFGEVREEVLAGLEELHRRNPRAPAASLQALREALGPVHSSLAERVISELEAAGAIEIRGGEVRRPGHRPSLTKQERRRREQLLATIREGGAEPPTVDELSGSVGGDRELLHDLLELLERDGQLVRVSPDLFVDPEVERELRRAARELVAERAPVPAGDFRAALGDLSRDTLIAYLEHFDRVGATRRTADGRVPADG